MQSVADLGRTAALGHLLRGAALDLRGHLGQALLQSEVRLEPQVGRKDARHHALRLQLVLDLCLGPVVGGTPAGVACTNVLKAARQVHGQLESEGQLVLAWHAVLGECLYRDADLHARQTGVSTQSGLQDTAHRTAAGVAGLLREGLCLAWKNWLRDVWGILCTTRVLAPGVWLEVVVVVVVWWPLW